MTWIWTWYSIVLILHVLLEKKEEKIPQLSVTPMPDLKAFPISCLCGLPIHSESAWAINDMMGLQNVRLSTGLTEQWRPSLPFYIINLPFSWKIIIPEFQYVFRYTTFIWPCRTIIGQLAAYRDDNMQLLLVIIFTFNGIFVKAADAGE